MNDSGSDGASVIPWGDSQEAAQILRLSPQGLRRLADLDEAINELLSARRVLISGQAGTLEEALETARNGNGALMGGNGHRSGAEKPPDLLAELRALRDEIAGMRQDFVDMRRALTGDPEAELQLLQRRLRYLEAELENREI